MQRGGREALIGAGRGCGVARISSSVRASPGGFGVRVRLPNPVQGEREVRGNLGGVLLAAGATASVRERRGGRAKWCSGCLANRQLGRGGALGLVRLAGWAAGCSWAELASVQGAVHVFLQKEELQ